MLKQHWTTENRLCLGTFSRRKCWWCRASRPENIRIALVRLKKWHAIIKTIRKSCICRDPPRDWITAPAASAFLRASLKPHTEPSQGRDICRRGQTCTQVTSSMLDTSKTMQNKSSSWGCCDLCCYRWVYSKWQKHLNDRVMVSPPKLHFLLHQTLLIPKL